MGKSLIYKRGDDPLMQCLMILDEDVVSPSLVALKHWSCCCSWLPQTTQQLSLELLVWLRDMNS